MSVSNRLTGKAQEVGKTVRKSFPVNSEDEQGRAVLKGDTGGVEVETGQRRVVMVGCEAEWASQEGR